MRKLLCVLLVLLVSYTAQGFESGKLDYEIRVDKWTSEYERMSFFVLPNQEVAISLNKPSVGKNNFPPLLFSLLENGAAIVEKKEKATWVAPSIPGVYELILQPNFGEQSKLLFFVMYPASKVVNGRLNGYTIGQYPKEALNGQEIYKPPMGFVEVTKQNQDIWVSPHYQLKQFLCKQNQGFPKYVVLRTRLLRKLEFLTEVSAEKGYTKNGFTIMSGYRTPYYNSLIKNKKYSRHQWGGAADIYIDENPKDGVMDDLNKDGKITVADAQVLWNLVESYYVKPEYKPMIGGLGLYKANAAHGPFVHVDVRGFRARW